MKKLTREDGASPDLVADNIERLRELFPEVFADGHIDFDALKETLGEYVDDREERYSFTWNGKSRAKQIAQTPSMGTLRPCPEESVNWDTTKNIFIEGDNLEVLKLLQKSYHRKVKMIYIDPPYNTGKEFIYPDKWQDNLDTYLRYTGQVDDEGFKLSANAETSGRYHTNWLNMMYPRLKLARNLLQDMGFIVVSIDDSELANLEYLLNEVFGEENRLAVLVFDRNRKNDAKLFSVGHEYMVVYCRNKLLLAELNVKLRTSKEGVDELQDLFESLRDQHGDDWEKIKAGIEEYYKSFDDDDPRKPLARFTQVDERGPFRTDGDPSWPGGGGPTYTVPHPVTGKPCKIPSRGWVWPTYERMKEEIEAGHIIFGSDESTVPSVRRNLFEKNEQVMRSVTFSYAQKTAQDFKSLFDGEKVFDNPKDPQDIRRLIEYLTDPKDMIIDFFAGSATSAHAVFDSNTSTGGDRRFVCVQLPERLDPTKKSQKAGHKFCRAKGLEPNIAEIAKERMRRAIRRAEGNRVRTEKPTDISQAKPLGFKVFKLSSSNIKPWQAEFDSIAPDLLESIDNIKPDRSEDDVLYELLLKYGLDLAIPTDTRDIEGRKVTVIGAGALIVCLADKITLEVVSGIAALKDELQPDVMRVVFKDAGFADDVAKTNAAQILKQAGIDDVKSL